MISAVLRLQRRRIERAGREADRAGIERFHQQRLHRRDLLGRGLAVEVRHGRGAQGRMADQRGDVVAAGLASKRAATQEAKVSWRSPSGAVDQVERHRQLHAAHQRRGADAAVAGDHRRHALRDLEVHVRLRQQRLIVVGVRVDEAGGDDQAGGIDVRAAFAPARSPTAAMRPSLTPTSASKRGALVPSMTVPPRISRS